LHLQLSDLPEEGSAMAEVVIIKNRETLDLVSLFEDAYGASHQLLERRL